MTYNNTEQIKALYLMTLFPKTIYSDQLKSKNEGHEDVSSLRLPFGSKSERDDEREGLIFIFKLKCF